MKRVDIIPCKKVCIEIGTPFELCCERNENRSRVVPKDKMILMNNQYDAENKVSLDEGWDFIQTVFK